MVQIIWNILAIAIVIAIISLLFRIAFGFLDLVKQSKSRVAVEEEMLQEIKKLNGKLDTIMAAANLESGNRFIPGGKNDN